MILYAFPPTHTHIPGELVNSHRGLTLTTQSGSLAPDKLSPSSRNKLGEGGIAALTHSHPQLQLGVSKAFG